MYPYFVPFGHHCCEEYGWVTVVEDGVPGHKGFSTHYRNLKQMETTKWPAQSSDLNLIENLQMDIENKLWETWDRIGDMRTLETALNMVWNSILDHQLEGLIRTIP